MVERYSDAIRQIIKVESYQSRVARTACDARADAPLTAAELFERIDRMPMREQMREREADWRG